MTLAAPYQEAKPEEEQPRPKLRPRPEPFAEDARRARDSQDPRPPLPSLPELEWASPGPGTVALPLPDFTLPAPSAAGGTGGSKGGRPVEATFHKEPFHWVYAPELNDREAMERAWPRRALLRGLGGKVVLEVTVGKNLRVRSARVVSAEPKGVFEKAAVRMVLRWRGSRPGTFLQPVRFIPPELNSW